MAAYFAEIDENNIVLRVLVTDDQLDDKGHGWLVENLGGTWIETEYDGSLRHRFAGIGFTYDETLDAFITPKCHDEAILNETTTEWDCTNADHEIEGTE